MAVSPVQNTDIDGPRAAMKPPMMSEPLHPIILIRGIAMIPAREECITQTIWE